MPSFEEKRLGCAKNPFIGYEFQTLYVYRSLPGKARPIWTPNTIVLAIGTPKKQPPNFGNPKRYTCIYI